MPEVYKVDKKFPLLFSVGSLFFLYIVQYWALRLLFPDNLSTSYSLKDWILAYLFVFASSTVFLFALYTGLAGGCVHVRNQSKTSITLKKPSFGLVLFIFLFFATWSYLMVRLKVGMTIFADFDPLPFRLVGLLFYGRLFIQPFVLMYIAYNFRRSHNRWLILLLLVSLGAWVSLASGSRFIAIMFSLPLLLLFWGKNRWPIWLGAVSAFITIATLTRHFYLPFMIGGEYIQIYANEEYQAVMTENIWMIAVGYLFGRTMGMSELLLTLNYGDISPTFLDAVQRLISVFLPFVQPGEGASIKNVYGLNDDVFGGYGLDLISNYWVMYGGTVPTYLAGILITGWLLGKTYRRWATVFLKVGGQEYLPFLFTLFFIIIFEGRISLFPYILLAGWIAGQPNSLRIFRTFVRLIFRDRKQNSLPFNSVYHID